MSKCFSLECSYIFRLGVHLQIRGVVAKYVCQPIVSLGTKGWCDKDMGCLEMFEDVGDKQCSVADVLQESDM